MQVEVRNVGADKARRGDPDLGVHVGAVEINLAAKLVHDLAHFANGLFIHAVGRRIGDHDAGEIGPRLLCFFTQIGEIDVAVFITGNDHYLHTRHLRGSRVGAVRGARDQADIAMAFVAVS